MLENDFIRKGIDKRVVPVPRQRSLLDYEDTPVWVRIGASVWLLLIALILYKRKVNERARDRMARRWLDPTDTKEWRLEPTRRKMVIEMMMITSTTFSSSKRGNENSDDSSSINQELNSLNMEVNLDGDGGEGDEAKCQIQEMSDDASSLCCPVCLDTLESNDAISWSKMFRCEHVFHTHCLTPWLMKNDDCPVCRTILIQNEDYKYLDIEENE